MAALVETMYYVSNEENGRFVPWHGLGTPVEKAPTSTEAIVLAGLDWTVDQRPIYDAFGKEIPKYVANTRSSDNSVLGIVTDKYKIVQNAEAFEFTDSLLDEGLTYETAGSLRDGKTVWLLAKMPQRDILGDAFEPYICFTNSHDGSGSIRVCMTPTRVVCWNTLNLAINTASRSWATKHMGDMKSKLDEAKHTLGLATAYINGLSAEAERLVNIKVSDDKLLAILDEMFPVDKDLDSKRKIINIEAAKNNILKCYDAPDIKGFKGTAWGIINAAADFVDHVTPTRLTKNYQENNWGRIMNGHPIVDTLLSKIAA